MIFAAGDWVQAIARVTEENFMGERLWVHAEPGAIGHVLDVTDEGGVNVYFERSGTVSICAPEELSRLGNYTGVPTPSPCLRS